MNNKEAIFAETVSILETCITQPYLLDYDIETFADVADELTHRGYKNSCGDKLTDNYLRVMFHRLDDDTKSTYREKYYPEMWRQSDFGYSYHTELVHKNRLTFLDQKRDVM